MLAVDFINSLLLPEFGLYERTSPAVVAGQEVEPLTDAFGNKVGQGDRSNDQGSE